MPLVQCTAILASIIMNDRAIFFALEEFAYNRILGLKATLELTEEKTLCGAYENCSREEAERIIKQAFPEKF